MKKLHGFSLFCIAIGFLFCSRSDDESYRAMKINFTEKMASGFANMAIKCVQQEFPNKLGHVINNSEEVQRPKTLHPAFYGCFDWHSAVHGHWMLVKLLKQFPELAETQKIREILNENMQPDNIKTEIEYYNQQNRKSFERTYGWAWLLKLTEEVYKFQDDESQKWYETLKPLADVIVDRYLDFLPKQTYAIRTGVHPNTAFGLAFAWDYAVIFQNKTLQDMISKKGKEFFGKDKEYPANWEPGGEDFFSQTLQEANFMRRILNKSEYQIWFKNFLPNLSIKKYTNILEPAIVTDRSDPKIVHLDGLNLSRAWCMNGIANSLDNINVKRTLHLSAYKHAKVALENIDASKYEGGHWLGTFSVYFLINQ